MTLYLDRPGRRLCRSDGRGFEPAARRWLADPAAATGQPVDLAATVAWLQRDSGRPCRVPVGVVGPRRASRRERRVAEGVGAALAGLGLTVLCGGRQGVMAAVCRGVSGAGGVSVGLLPEGDPAAANRYVGIPIATGIGLARNAIIARAALCLVAVGGGYGTTSEVALALQFGTPVFGLCEAPPIPGVIACDAAEVALDHVARTVLSIPLDESP